MTYIQAALFLFSVLLFAAGLLLLAFPPEGQDAEGDALDAEYRPVGTPAVPPSTGSSPGWQDSRLHGISSQTFMAQLSPEEKRAIRRNAEELEKAQKWRYYAAHAKKGRTRKKYRNKLREYYRSHSIPWYWLPSNMELTSGHGHSSGRGLDSGSLGVIWWFRRPGHIYESIYPVSEGGRVADWGPRPL